MLPRVSDSFHAQFPVSVKSVTSVFVRSGVAHNRPRQWNLPNLPFFEQHNSSRFSYIPFVLKIAREYSRLSSLCATNGCIRRRNR